MEGREYFEEMVLEQLEMHMQKNELRHRPYTLYKNLLQMIRDLNVKCKTKTLRR